MKNVEIVQGVAEANAGNVVKRVFDIADYESRPCDNFRGTRQFVSLYESKKSKFHIKSENINGAQ